MNFILAVLAIVFEILLGIDQSKESFFVYDKILTKITLKFDTSFQWSL